METRVKITHQENEEVKNLFYRLNSYYSILGYLAKYGSLDTNLFDKKWEEAIKIGMELDELKVVIDKKYHPIDGNVYNNYSFDFITEELVYSL